LEVAVKPNSASSDTFGIRLSRFVLPGCLFVCALPAGLSAQTVVYTGRSTLGSGFLGPQGVAVDGSGNVYVADTYNNAVKEILAVGGSIPANPTISTLGSGFNTPGGVAVDGSGNVYVADSFNSAVKEILAVGGSIPPSPTIRTLGSGFTLPHGVTVDGSGNVYVADINTGVYEMLAVGGSIPASPTIRKLGSGFTNPYGVTVDGSGNVYVADYLNNAVKEMVAVGGSIPPSPTINTLGSGFSGPQSVAVDGSGNVYVGDLYHDAVKEILAVNGSIPATPVIKTLGGGSPLGVALDGSRNVYVADAFNNAVDEFLATGTNFGNINLGTTSVVLPLVFTFVTGSTGISSAVLTLGVTGLDFADAGTGSCTTNGINFVYSAGDTCAVNVTFTPKHPGLRPGAVQVFDAETGEVLATVPIYGVGIGSQIGFVSGAQNVLGKDLGQTVGVAVDGIGDLFIGDTTNGRVVEVLADGGQEATVATGLDQPGEIAVDGAGDVFIADTNNARVLELPAGGGLPTTVGSGLAAPTGVAVDGAGDVFISDFDNNNVVEVLAYGSGQNTVITGLDMPKGMALDGAGDIFIANDGGGNVLELPAGSSTPVAVGSGFSEPDGVAVDAAGNVFVADQDNNYIVEVPASGGAQIDLGNNGFNGPKGVAVDLSGDIFVADTSNDRVVELPFSKPPSMILTPTASTQTVTLESIGNLALVLPGAESATNPTISDSSFVLNSGGATACAVVTAGASPLGTLAPGFTCDLTVTFSPTNGGTQSGKLVLTDNSRNPAPTGFTSQTIPLRGTANANLPEITWATPGPIQYGTALSATQLNATANVAGSFTYEPADGTVLGAGKYTLLVTFTPTNTSSFTTASTTVTLTVNKAVTAITWATPAAIAYGTPLSATQLDATSPVAGNFVYDPPAGTSFPVGLQTLSVTFKPTNTTDYTTATATINLTVTKAAPAITWATPAPITYGTAVGPTQQDATANVAGTFVYEQKAGWVPIAGTHTMTVTFTPTDTSDYKTATATVTLTVNQATPVITWLTPAPITYGTAVGPTQQDATANVAGTFVYEQKAGWVPIVGTHTMTVTFAPTDALDYKTVTATVTLTVNPAT
jgi:sugar lactone lactonase YvrE